MRKINLTYLIGDLSINCSEYFGNEKVSTFYNSPFEYGAIALINKLTRVAKKFATIIDVITTKILDESFKKGMIKSDLSDHLPIFFSISTLKWFMVKPQMSDIRMTYAYIRVTYG